MDSAQLRRLLTHVSEGEITPDAAAEQLRHLPYEDLGFARLDHHRAIRDQLPEVVLADGKSTEQVVAVSLAILERSKRLLITRTSTEQKDALEEAIPDIVRHEPSRALSVDRRSERPPLQPGILIICGGTADLPVVGEAAATIALMGHAAECLIDVGVAGLHRLLDQFDRLRAARVIIVVAGMDAALPSVVAGLTSAPVIAVPTSTGYGASFEGLAALLALLNACASGVTVVNIDNGFGAGYQAALINALADPPA